LLAAMLLTVSANTSAVSRTFQEVAQQASIDIPELKPGQPVEREIDEGQAHFYRVTLSPQQFIHLTVEQKDIDAGIRLFDPAGKMVAWINWEGQGLTESLWALAETAGEYQIRISADIKGANNRYVVTLDKVGSLETATSNDRAYVIAHQLFFQAGQLRDRGDQFYSQAIEKLRAALPLWRQVNNRVGEAFTLHELAFVVWSKMDATATDLYEQALTLWRELKNRPRNEADTLYNLGSLYAFIGRAAEAISCFQKTIELRRQMHGKDAEAFALTNLGQVYNNIGEFQAALEAHKEALRLRRETGELEGQARSLSNISGVYFGLGEFQEALNYCLQALPLRRAAGDRKGEGITLNNIGTNYRELGEPQRALDYYQQAFVLISGIDEVAEATLLDGMGRAYFDLGDYQKALEHHNKALLIRQKFKDSYGEGSTLVNLGNCYARTGKRETAIDYFERALRLQRATGDRRGEALTLRNAGELYADAGDLQKALDYFDQGLKISREIKSRFLEANLLYSSAQIERRQKHLSRARSMIEAGIAIIENTRAKVSSAELRAAFFASKQDFYELEIDLLMQSCLDDRDERTLARAFGVSEQRRARGLLESLEEARANIRQGAAQELLARERALRAKLNQQAESQIKLLSGEHTADQANALAKKLDATTIDYEQILTQIKTSTPRYASLTQPPALSLRDVQSLLGPDSMLLEYALGKERSYLWAITSTSIRAFRLSPRAEIEAQARRVYELMTARNRRVKFEESQDRQVRIARADADYLQEASKLSRILLGSVSELAGYKQLLIVSDGVLQYLPFAALPLPSAAARSHRENVALISEHEVIGLPSASTLAVLRKETAGRQPAPKMIAVLADPVFDKNDERVIGVGSATSPEHPLESTEEDLRAADPQTDLGRSITDLSLGGERLYFRRLPFTNQEAMAIASLAPPNEEKTATGFAATRAAAIAPEMSQYRYIHFATHGLLNNTHPGLSGIVLSLVDEHGKAQDGFLSTNEIYNLNLPADLVVLSGCRTGLGRELRGEGILGLARAFMYAGAPRVVVSLWDVSDQSTAQLMSNFYKAMLGKKRLSPAAALRFAQLEMQKSARWNAPYFWSAFVLQGEYK
jgi:CHAT domain-containing protein/Flp pilus assembly protein TadD